jgi:hypothetical protein
MDIRITREQWLRIGSSKQWLRQAAPQDPQAIDTPRWWEQSWMEDLREQFPELAGKEKQVREFLRQHFGIGQMPPLDLSKEPGRNLTDKQLM